MLLASLDNRPAELAPPSLKTLGELRHEIVKSRLSRYVKVHREPCRVGPIAELHRRSPANNAIAQELPDDDIGHDDTKPIRLVVAVNQ